MHLHFCNEICCTAREGGDRTKASHRCYWFFGSKHFTVISFGSTLLFHHLFDYWTEPHANPDDDDSNGIFLDVFVLRVNEHHTPLHHKFIFCMIFFFDKKSTILSISPCDDWCNSPTIFFNTFTRKMRRERETALRQKTRKIYLNPHNDWRCIRGLRFHSRTHSERITRWIAM